MQIYMGLACLVAFSMSAPAWAWPPPQDVVVERGGASIPSAVSASKAGETTYFFNFGDSYSATGFNLSDKQPLPGDPLGNPKPDQDGFAGGPDWVAWLTTTYNKSLVLDYDLAFGGATINDSVVPSHAPGIRSFQDQVEKEFKPRYGNGKTPPWKANKNSIFSIFLGINDVGGTYEHKSEFAEDLNPLLDSYFTLCSELYDTGARNFLFINTPPVNRSAATLKSSAMLREEHGRDIVKYNTALEQRIPLWAKQHAGVQHQTYDYFSFMNTVLDHPTRYGFENNTCAGNGTSHCVWWEPSSLHTTSRFQKLVAKNMVAKLTPLGW